MRKDRLYIDNATYHTMSRAIELRGIMTPEDIKSLFEECLKKALAKYKFELCDYQIMDNHFHLLIRVLPGEANISRIMQYIKSRFARRFNYLTKRTGPVWNERFKDTIVELADSPRLYLFNLIWYFANNPVKAGKIQSPFESWWGASKAYFDAHFKPSVPITLHKYFLELGATINECIETLKGVLRGEVWI